MLWLLLRARAEAHTMWEADEIARLCYEHYETRLPKQGKPEPNREWTLLAAVVKVQPTTDQACDRAGKPVPGESSPRELTHRWPLDQFLFLPPGGILCCRSCKVLPRAPMGLNNNVRAFEPWERSDSESF